VGELAERGGVEGPGLHPVEPQARPAEQAQPPAQLTRRPRGERQCEHVRGIHHSGVHGVGDPVRDRAGLAGARASQHAHRTARDERDLALLGIQRVEHRRCPVGHVRPVDHIRHASLVRHVRSAQGVRCRPPIGRRTGCRYCTPPFLLTTAIFAHVVRPGREARRCFLR
jgi:hypothetical protein